MEILISETWRRFKWIPSGNNWLVAFDCVLIILFTPFSLIESANEYYINVLNNKIHKHIIIV
jgi:hypothetical protein